MRFRRIAPGPIHDDRLIVGKGGRPGRCTFPLYPLPFFQVDSVKPPALVIAAMLAAFLAAPPAHADSPDDAPALIATGDFNHDGIADMVQVSTSEPGGSGPHRLIIMLGHADGTFEPMSSQNLIGANPRALVVGDFNRDGKLDVIVGDANGALLEFLGDGRGNLTSAGAVARVGSVASIAVGRFTSNSNLGLVVSDVGSNSAAILLGSGDGTFHLAWSFALPRAGTEFHLATADFNRDGIPDLVITSEDSDDYEVMLGNGNGTFTYAPELSHLKDPNSYCPT